MIMLIGNKKDIVDKNEDQRFINIIINHCRKVSSGYASDFA